MNTKGFFDLCVPENHFTKENCVATLKVLRQYGYRTIAINQVIREKPEANKENNKKKKKKGDAKDNNELVPEPIKIDETLLKDFEDMTILNRLTVTFSDKDFYYKVTKSPNFKKYTILAVLPTTKIAFMFICTSVEADILTYCGEEKEFRIDRNSYNHLIRKGFFFEILYGPTKEDSTIRKNTINRSHLYHSIGKSRNIILSSGVSNLIYLSSAYDVINLGIIFGLNMQQAKDAISHHGLELCPKAVGRCHGKSIVMVETIASNDDISLIEIDDSVQIVEEISTVQIEDSDEETMLLDEPVPKKMKRKK
ncbi:ribonuclease P protein subunit p30 [Harmonia axyridis]|uniref:ribonuclease P protein subunit p30 n=1 Tax=Harmonia axyridis TaxID=115357 RepID=UPI001E27963E|nr:ribonuclease P protein subunit p30 [Harmonia axyridis]